jgi:predicted enzyme related to lactoylglutathione lyase
MGCPVVHFEIHATDRKELKGFYQDLFGWKIKDNNPLGYGIVDTDADKKGIGGGLYEQDSAPAVVIYVEVDDPEEYLDRVEDMGGDVIVPVTSIPGMVTYAVFEDPQGNKIGLVKKD